MIKIIYHGNCSDGFCAAWLGHLVWPDAQFIPRQHGQECPEINETDDVIIVDFSYPREILLDIKKKAKSLIVLDHHASAQENLAGLDFCVFDMKRSGARLFWDYLYQQGLAPHGYLIHWLVKYVEDRDLWLKALPHSNEINAALRSYPLDFQVWDEISRRDPQELVAEGIAAIRVNNQIIDHHLKHLQVIELDGEKGLGCPCSVYSIWSDIMDKILTIHNPYFAIVWTDSIDKRIYSIRSKDGGPDVSKIARKFNGGGHVRASGFTVALCHILPQNITHSAIPEADVLAAASG